jgi:hypothetical protein
MALDPDIRSEPSLISRIKGILLAPKLEWPKIAAEPATINSLYLNYIVPLGGFAALCGFIRNLLGVTVLGVTYRPTYTESLTSAVWQLALQLGGVFILALIMETLAPYFGGQKDRIGALKLAAYSATAAWLSNVFLLIPWLGLLTILSLYTFYLISTGVPVLLKVPENRAVAFTASLVAIGIVASLIFFATIGPFLYSGSGNVTTPASQGEQPTSGELSIPGIGKIDFGKLDELGKRLESLSKGGTKLPAIPTVDLVELMPTSLPGFTRTEISTSESGAGIDLGAVSAVYANGDNVITLSLSDMGLAGAMASLTGAIGLKTSEQTNDTYRKLATVDRRMTMEEYDTKARIGSFGTMIADRVMVKAEGRGVSVEQLKSAVHAVDAQRIEALAKH